MHLDDLPINWRLVGHPLNWFVVGAVAMLWLLMFHSVAMGLTMMNVGKDVAAGRT